jgi:hypothetical protein
MFGRDRWFLNPDPLEPRLRPNIGRIAEIRLADEQMGYLHLTLKTIARFTGPPWRRKMLGAREQLAWAVVLLSNNELVEYLDGEYDNEPEAVSELSLDTFSLRGMPHSLTWLDEPRRDVVLSEFFE